MKLIYEAPNTIEAHLILNLLEQAGLSARIDGEYLQGGVGELQAIGIVRVMVEESDYPEAEQIVKKWDERTPAAETIRPTKPKRGLGQGILGFIAGAGAMALYVFSSGAGESADCSEIGMLDTKPVYAVSVLESNARIAQT